MSGSKKLLEVTRHMWVVDINRPLRRIEKLGGTLVITEKSMLFRPLSGRIKACNVGISAFTGLREAMRHKYVVLKNGLRDAKRAPRSHRSTDMIPFFEKQMMNYDKARDFFETSECATLFSGGKKNL